MKKDKKDPILQKFGEKVKYLRNKQKLSQEKLADAANLHWTYISGIERGLRNISLKNILKIAKALGLKPKNLLDSLVQLKNRTLRHPSFNPSSPGASRVLQL